MNSCLAAVFFGSMSLSFAPVPDITITDMVGGSEEIVLFKKVDEGEPISFKVEASDGSIPKAQNLPVGSSYQNGVFSWTPGETQSALYALGFYSGGAYKNLRIAVANTQFRIPVGETFEYLFMATDPDGDNVSLSLSGMPTGATFVGGDTTPKLFTWTPTASQVGTHVMTLVAQDQPASGVAKQDTSTIRIVVSKLTYEDMPFDFNKDGEIDMADYALFASKWLKGVPRTKKNKALVERTPEVNRKPVRRPQPVASPTEPSEYDGMSPEEIFKLLLEKTKTQSDPNSN